MKCKIIYFVLSITLINVCSCSDTEKKNTLEEKTEKEKYGKGKSKEKGKAEHAEDPAGRFLNFFRKLGTDELKAQEKGERQYRKQKYREALTSFSIAIEKSKTFHPSHYIYRAKCYLKLGKVKDAISDFKELLIQGERVDPSSAAENQKLVIAAAVEFDEFHEIMTRIESINSHKIAEVAFEKCTKEKSFTQADRLYTEALVRERFREYYLSRAICHIELKRLDRAKSDLIRARTAESCYDRPCHDHVPVTPEQLGVGDETRIILLEAWADSASSIEDLQRKRWLSEEEAVREAQVLFDQQVYYVALLMYNVAFNKTKSAMNCISRGKCYLKLGRLKEAVLDFYKALEGDAPVGTSGSEYDVIKAILDLEESGEILERMINNISVHRLFEIANVLCSENRFLHALHVYNKVVSKRRECGEHFFARAVCLLKIGKLDQAREDWFVAKGLEKCYEGQRLPERASTFTLLDLWTKFLPAMDHMMKSELHENDLKGKLLRDHEDFADVGYGLLLSGKFQEAILFYSAAIEMNPLLEYLERRRECFTKLEEKDSKAIEPELKDFQTRLEDKEILPILLDQHEEGGIKYAQSQIEDKKISEGDRGKETILEGTKSKEGGVDLKDKEMLTRNQDTLELQDRIIEIKDGESHPNDQKIPMKSNEGL